MEYKKKGNEDFSRKSYSIAIENYKKALFNLEFNNENDHILCKTNIESIKIECFNNLAICYLVKSDYLRVLSYTEKTLDIQIKNYKALYIRSKAYKKLNKLEESKEVLKQVKSYFNNMFLGN